MVNNESSYQIQAYTHVRSQIITLEYKPGDFITDSQVAGELDISRTPVREAFQRLANEGLLINVPRKGWQIYSLSLADIEEIFDIKMVVEGLIARRAAACTDEHLMQELQTAVVRMNDAAEISDSDAWLNADVALHEVLFEMAQNGRAQRIILNLNDQWHRVRVGFVAMQGRIHLSTQEHKELVESILAGNGEQAEQQMRTHLNNVRTEVVRLLSVMVLPFTNNGV